MNDAERLWKTCSEALRPMVSEAVWHGTFEGVVALDSEDPGELLLGVPSSLVKELSLIHI